MICRFNSCWCKVLGWNVDELGVFCFSDYTYHIMASFAARMLTPGRVATLAALGVGTAAYHVTADPQHARNWHSLGHLKYPASANFPDLTVHNNFLRDHLTPGVSIPPSILLCTIPYSTPGPSVLLGSVHAQLPRFLSKVCPYSLSLPPSLPSLPPFPPSLSPLSRTKIHIRVVL